MKNTLLPFFAVKHQKFVKIYESALSQFGTSIHETAAQIKVNKTFSRLAFSLFASNPQIN